jgi:hypothetical protein
MNNNNADMRNLARNLMLKAATKQFPGNQRITTGRDSLAFNEGISTQQPTTFNTINLNGIVGYAQAGE